MRAKKIATQRSLNENDVTLKPTTRDKTWSLPLIKVLKVMAAVVAVAAVYSLIR